MFVIIDVGCAGKLPKYIKQNIKDALYIGFDRDIPHVEAKKVIYKRVVVDEPKGYVDFYVTKSSYCSSTLKPIISGEYYESLKFDVDWVVKMPSITLAEVIVEHGLVKIDILKLDTQGTDLRLLKSCPIKPKTVMVEPGIISAYENEDKLEDFFEWFRENNYKCISMRVGYLHKRNELLAFPFINKLNYYVGKIPAWLEMTWRLQ